MSIFEENGALKVPDEAADAWGDLNESLKQVLMKNCFKKMHQLYPKYWDR